MKIGIFIGAAMVVSSLICGMIIGVQQPELMVGLFCGSIVTGWVAS